MGQAISMSLKQTITAAWNSLLNPTVTRTLLTACSVLAAHGLYTLVFAPRLVKNVYHVGFPITLTGGEFFKRRFDFLRSILTKYREEMVLFKVFNTSVIAMQGIEGRKEFFNHRDLDITNGYDIILGGASRFRNLADPHSNLDGMAWLSKQTLALLSKERLAEALPVLFDDIHRYTEEWGKDGTLDPFKAIYDIGFQLNIRVASCRELADDMEATKKLQQAFADLDDGSTPVALLLPWLPSEGRRKEQAANAALRTMLRTYVEKRNAATTPNSDAIDVLLSQGLPADRIMNCLLSIITVGVINASISICWTLILLSEHVEWKQKVIDEVKSIIKKYTGDSVEPLHKLLATLPMSVWEEEMPVFDLVLRESLRLTMNGAMPRYNHRDLEILGRRVPKGSYVVYQLADVHLNPDIYENPTAFDPMRFGPGREEDKKEQYAYLAWGVGRHPCTGMKFAKLQVKMVVSYFLCAYQYDVVDKNGVALDPLPTPNYNDISKSQPDKEQVYFKFRRTLD